jgi:hypothetical protein
MFVALLLRGAKMETGLNGRHRDKNGEISHRHGNTLVGTLRKVYGPSFAAEQSETAKLSEILADLNEGSRYYFEAFMAISERHSKKIAG